jgi:hypothetical protein
VRNHAEEHDETQAQKPEPKAALEQIPAGGFEAARQIAIVQMAHFVALKRYLSPRKGQTDGDESQQVPETSAPGIGPTRSRHPKAHPAPYGSGRPITPRAEDRELGEGKEKQEERDAGESFGAFELDADEEVHKVDRHEDREREQETEQELLGGAGIFSRIARH